MTSKRKLRAEILRLREQKWELAYENARLRFRLDGTASTGFPMDLTPEQERYFHDWARAEAGFR